MHIRSFNWIATYDREQFYHSADRSKGNRISLLYLPDCTNSYAYLVRGAQTLTTSPHHARYI